MRKKRTLRQKAEAYLKKHPHYDKEYRTCTFTPFYRGGGLERFLKSAKRLGYIRFYKVFTYTEVSQMYSFFPEDNPERIGVTMK